MGKFLILLLLQYYYLERLGFPALREEEVFLLFSLVPIHRELTQLEIFPQKPNHY